MRLPYAAGLILLLAAPALAGPESKPEDEGKALQRIVRTFGKLKGYAVDVHVEGGQAEGAEHRITKPTVNTTYAAEVHGPVCRVVAPQALRPRAGEGGAIANGTRWVAMLSTDDGRKLERLFPRPEVVLAEVLRMKGTARWVDPPAGAQQPAPPEAPAADADEDEDGTPAPADGTQERGDDEAGEASQAPASNHLRVTAPPTVALEHFIRIQNSGCFAEG